MADRPVPGPYDIGPFQEITALAWGEGLVFDLFIYDFFSPQDQDEYARCPDGVRVPQESDAYYTLWRLPGNAPPPSGFSGWGGTLTGDTSGAVLDLAGVCVTVLQPSWYADSVSGGKGGHGTAANGAMEIAWRGTAPILSVLGFVNGETATYQPPAPP